MKELTHIDVYTSTVASDGGIVERIGGHQLVRSVDGRIETAEEFACGDVLYRCGQLPRSLEMALKLPATYSDTDDPELFTKLRELFLEAAGVSEGDAVILAACVLTTWMGGFRSGLCLNLVGPQAVTAPLKTLLLSISRNPLALATFDLKEMARLPADLWPTVLICSPSARSLRELELATATGSVQVVRQGNIEVVPRCQGIIFTEEPALLPAVSIHLIGQSVARFHAGYLKELEDRIRPALLRFRLSHFATIESSTWVVGDFSPEVERWSRVLGTVVAPFVGAPAEVIEALRPHDHAQQAILADSIEATIIEALFLAIHASRPPLFIQDVARIANLLLAGRGESELTARATGSILRKFGVSSGRTGAGYRLEMSPRERQRVHRLAERMGVPLPLENSAGCTFCAELSPRPEGSGHDSGSPDVHEVHDVHPTREMGSTEGLAPSGGTGEEAR